jgi:hypothetical protein
MKHVAPINEANMTATGYCHAMNSGLVHAAGDIALFISDYTWLNPNCLQTHYDFHQSNNNYGFICSYNVCKLPKMHSDLYRVYAGNVPYDTVDNRKKFVEQEVEAFTSYINDLSSGKLNNMMWSIFDSKVDIETVEISSTKDYFPEGDVGTNCCYLRNESHKLDNIINMNGFNEELDGSHGWQDWEFIGRLTARYGTKLYYNPIITATMFDCRTILYGRLR